MILREATEADWPAILPILRAAASTGETYDWPLDITDEELRAMWLGQPGWTTVVACDDDGTTPGGTTPGDTVLGVADFGPNRIGRGAHVANASFVVAEHAAGRGVGRALGEHVLAAATAAGFLGMQFNAVVETNTRAVALWQSLGFTIIGTVPKAFDHATCGLVGLHIMHRSLGDD